MSDFLFYHPGKRNEGCRSGPASCKTHMRGQELNSTAVLTANSCLCVLVANSISLLGGGSWCQVLPAFSHSFCSPVILSSLCHECDPCHVFLLSSDPHHGEIRQQRVSSSSSDVLGIQTLGATPCMVVPPCPFSSCPKRGWLLFLLLCFYSTCPHSIFC